jgi:hypothetical protein
MQVLRSMMAKVLLMLAIQMVWPYLVQILHL